MNHYLYNVQATITDANKQSRSVTLSGETSCEGFLNKKNMKNVLQVRGNKEKFTVHAFSFLFLMEITKTQMEEWLK